MKPNKTKQQFRPGDIVTINRFIEYPSIYNGTKNPRTYRVVKLLEVPVPKHARYYEEYDDDFRDYDDYEPYLRQTARDRVGATQQAILAPNRTMEKVYRKAYGSEPIRILGKLLARLRKRQNVYSCAWLTLVHRPSKSK